MKKKNFSSLVVFISFFVVSIFTIVVLILNGKGLEVSETLIEWVFKFFGLEMLALSGIKISKHIGSAFGALEDAVDGLVEDEEDEEDDNNDDEDSED